MSQSTNLFIVIFSILASTLLVGCARHQFSNDEKTMRFENYIQEASLEELNKIRAFKLQSWQSLNKRFLILKTHVNRAYLIKLKRDCHDITYSSSIAINYDASTLQAKHDSISVPNSTIGQCYIQTIYPITKAQVNDITNLNANPKSGK